MEKALLKVLPVDFKVNERIMLKKNNHQGKYQYLKLTKCGYTTFQAIEKLSAYLTIKENEIQFAGLKDEDGITEQFISTKQYISQQNIQKFNEQFILSIPKNYISIESCETGENPINIGELEGNEFNLTIRQLSKTFVQKIITSNKVSDITTLNYYGHQRFGYPNRIKNNHLIGRELIKNNIGKALQFIENSMKDDHFKEKKMAIDSISNPNSKRHSFYKNAYYSHIWNTTLKEQIIKYSKGSIYIYKIEDIDYIFPKNQNYIHELPSFLPYRSIRINENGEAIEYSLNRKIIISTKICFSNIKEDEMNPGYYKVTCVFFLPKGCYATIFIPQALKFVSRNK